VVPGDCSAARLRAVELELASARGRCLVVDMTHGPAAPPELAHAVARLIGRARRHGFSVAVASPGAELVRELAATGVRRGVELVPTAAEALARVRGRLTPCGAIRVLDARPAG
jgi:polysaccharide deacetylase 2 family uncharacterized protein YibQ